MSIKILIIAVFIFIFGYALVSCAVMTVDRITNVQITVIQIHGKEQHTSTNCDEDGHCSTTHYYYAETDKGSMEVNGRTVYSALIVGKKHHVEIKGERFPLITKVFE